MTFIPEEAPKDPEVVFTPEYWGDSNEAFPRESFVRIPRAEWRNAEALMRELALKAIDGSLRGTQVVPGAVFDITDEKVAANSPHNFPGTLLLYEIESLRRLNAKSAKSLEERGQDKDAADRNAFGLSPRGLIRSRITTCEHGTVHYGPGRTTYSNGDKVYYRKANIAYIAPARRGARQIIGLVGGGYNPLSTDVDRGYHHDYTYLLRDPNLHGGAVAETQVSYSTDGREFERAYRIRSLEILAGGQPAVASQRRTSFLLRPSTTQ